MGFAHGGRPGSWKALHNGLMIPACVVRHAASKVKGVELAEGLLSA